MNQFFDPPSSEALRAAEDFLIEFGVPPHLGGFNPLAISIAIASEHQDIGSCLVKKIYPTVVRGLRLTIKPANLSNRIATAIETGFANCDYKKYDKFFGGCLNPDRGNLRNAEFIALAAVQVRRRVEDHYQKNKKERN